MSELSDQRSLAQELLAREHRLVFGQPALIDLDGHFRARKFVECQVHLARRATAELPLNAIFADSLSHALLLKSDRSDLRRQHTIDHRGSGDFRRRARRLTLDSAGGYVHSHEYWVRSVHQARLQRCTLCDCPGGMGSPRSKP